MARGAPPAHRDRHRAPAAARSRRRLHVDQPGRAVHSRGSRPAAPVDDPGVLPRHGSRRAADRAVPVRTQEVRERADAAPQGRALSQPRPLRRLQSARHPGQQPTQPAGPRRPRERGGERVLRRGTGPRGRPVRDPGGDVPSESPAARARALHRVRPRAPLPRPRARAGAACPRVGRWRTGRGAVVPSGCRGVPAPVGRPRAAHRDRDRTGPPRPGRRRAHPPCVGGDRARGGALPPGPRRRDGRLGRVREPGGLQHDDGHPRLYDAGRRRAVLRRDALDWTPLAVPLDLDGRTRTSELLQSLCPARDAETAP